MSAEQTPEQIQKRITRLRQFGSNDVEWLLDQLAEAQRQASDALDLIGQSAFAHEVERAERDQRIAKLERGFIAQRKMYENRLEASKRQGARINALEEGLREIDNRVFFCRYCICWADSIELLDKHMRESHGFAG